MRAQILTPAAIAALLISLIAWPAQATEPGVFLCQAFATTPGEALAGDPDHCVTDVVAQPYSGPPIYNLQVGPEVATYAQANGGRAVMDLSYASMEGFYPFFLDASNVESRAAVGCSLAGEAITTGSSSVGTIGVFVQTGLHDSYGVYERVADHRSVDLGGGWRLDLNLTERITDGETTLLRQSAIRVTGPSGTVAAIGVTEAGTRGDACF